MRLGQDFFGALIHKQRHGVEGSIQGSISYMLKAPAFCLNSLFCSFFACCTHFGPIFFACILNNQQSSLCLHCILHLLWAIDWNSYSVQMSVLLFAFFVRAFAMLFISCWPQLLALLMLYASWQPVHQTVHSFTVCFLYWWLTTLHNAPPENHVESPMHWFYAYFMRFIKT